jgi:hypothetical protein
LSPGDVVAITIGDLTLENPVAGQERQRKQA